MTIADQVAQRHSIEAALHALLSVEDLGAAHQSLHERLSSLEKKLAADKLHLAVLGQMKRGKSSFINALLGAEILPTGVLPVTAVITEIKYGPDPEGTIVYSTGGLREKVDLGLLAGYITEAGNPGNKKQVASVEIAYPSPFLENGIVLIDTPGIGSTHIHNTRTTESYLENVDAGILVLSVDPPITEVESHFLRAIKAEIPKLFFILNKTDSASREETCNILRFLEGELERLQIEAPEIFALSAREALQEKRQAHRISSLGGLDAFEQRLRTFVLEEKGHVLVRSIALDALHIARTLKFATAIGIRASEMSAEELHVKRLALDRLLKQTESEVRELQLLLRQRSADIVARVERGLSAQVEHYVPEVRHHLRRFQAGHPGTSGRAIGALLEDFMLKEVESVFRRWRMREDEEVQAELDALSSRFVALANEILGRLEQAASALFQAPVERLSIVCPLRMESHLSYKVDRVFHSLDSFFLLLPRLLLRPIVFRRTYSAVPRLLDVNAGRIRYDYLERLQSSMVRFDKDILAAITMVTENVKSALHAPRSTSGQQRYALELLDVVIRDCSQLSAPPSIGSGAEQ